MDYLLRQQYYEYIKENSAPGSGTAHSYVAALDMLGAILQNRTFEFSQYSNLWNIKNPQVIVQEKDIDFRSKAGKDILIQTKARVNQDFFRKMILAEYNTQCCITGLNIPEILRASHIVGWAEDKNNRMNPANGLCLSATYDAAFDRHLISFDDDYRLILSSSLKEHYTNKAFKEQFLKFEGRILILPGRFMPNHGLLEKHRGQMVV